MPTMKLHHRISLAAVIAVFSAGACATKRESTTPCKSHLAEQLTSHLAVGKDRQAVIDLLKLHRLEFTTESEYEQFLRKRQPSSDEPYKGVDSMMYVLLATSAGGLVRSQELFKIGIDSKSKIQKFGCEVLLTGP